VKWEQQQRKAQTISHNQETNILVDEKREATANVSNKREKKSAQKRTGKRINQHARGGLKNRPKL